MNLYFLRLMGQMLIFRKKYIHFRSLGKEIYVLLLFAELKILFYPVSRLLIILYSDHFAPYFYTICKILKYVFS